MTHTSNYKLPDKLLLGFAGYILLLIFVLFQYHNSCKVFILTLLKEVLNHILEIMFQQAQRLGRKI